MDEASCTHELYYCGIYQLVVRGTKNIYIFTAEKKHDMTLQTGPDCDEESGLS